MLLYQNQADSRPGFGILDFDRLPDWNLTIYIIVV
jgi:hypothetical protein